MSQHGKGHRCLNNFTLLSALIDASWDSAWYARFPENGKMSAAISHSTAFQNHSFSVHYSRCGTDRRDGIKLVIIFPIEKLINCDR